MLQAFFRTGVIVAGLLLWSGTGHARLIGVVVGVSDYSDPQLARAALPGAGIDAAAIAAALRAHGAAPQDVTLIAGPAATAAVIRRTLDRVAASITAQDRVVLYLAGHGAQIPAPAGDRAEPDGLDEMFLAADAHAWDAARKVLPGAIRDDEFGGWIDQIRGRGASVWFVVDACNGGGLQRGGTDAQARVIDPALLRLPAVLRGGRADASGLADATPMQGGGKLVTFYAAPAGGIAWERPLAEGGDAVVRRGVFTWTLLRALDGAATDADFLSLAGSADTARRALGPPGGPAWIGGDLDQPILFSGGGTDLLAHAKAASATAPISLRIAVGPAGRGCPGADPDPATLAPAPVALRVQGCRRVLVDLHSTAATPVTVRPWYRAASGGYVALAGVNGVALAPAADARFSFTVMDRDPDTGRDLPSGIEYLLLIADTITPGTGAIVVPLTTGK